LVYCSLWMLTIPPTKIDLGCANWLGHNNARQHLIQLLFLC
jgi:hypothetical protein